MTIKITTKKIDAMPNGDAKTEAMQAIWTEIEAALHAVNGRAESFAITSGAAVCKFAREVEATLDKRGVTKKNRVGTIAFYTPSGPSANSYKYGAKSTTIKIQRVTDGWRLVDVTEVKVWPKTLERRLIKVSVAAAEDIRKTAFDEISIVESEGDTK